MSGVFDSLASTLTYYTGYDFTGTATPAQSTPYPSLTSSSSSAPLRGTADFSSFSSAPLDGRNGRDGVEDEDENLTSLYQASGSVDDDEFFNLGGSSFPLLPHAPYMVDPFEEEEDEEDEGQEQRRSWIQAEATASRSSHHFSSVLNNPLSSYTDFEEEDMLPFSPSYIHALTDHAIDSGAVRSFVEQMGGEVDSFVENHPGALHAVLGEGEAGGRVARVSPRSSTPTSSSSTPSHLLSPFSSLPPAFTFSRRRTASSHSARHRRGHSQSSSSSSSSSAELVAVKVRQEEEIQAQRELMDCLSTVPAPFFSSSFDLMQQPFFLDLLHSISFPTSSSVVMKQHTGQSLALQSTLSSHLDQVELNLFRQINARSHLFFNQMEAVERMNDEIGDCLSSIDDIQSALSYVDEQLISGGLQVVTTHRHRQSLLLLLHKIEAMQQCTKTQQTVQLLLSTGDYTSSLMLIQQTRSVLSSELMGVSAMRNVDRKLQEQVRLIEKLMEVEMMRIIRQQGEGEEERDGDERRSGKRETGAGSGAGLQVIRRELTDDEKERLVPLLENLIKLHALSTVLSSYKKELQEQIKQRLTDRVYHHIHMTVNEDLEDTNTTTTTTTPPINAPLTAPSSNAAVAVESASPPDGATSASLSTVLPSSSPSPSSPSSVAVSSVDPASTSASSAVISDTTEAVTLPSTSSSLHAPLSSSARTPSPLPDAPSPSLPIPPPLSSPSTDLTVPPPSSSDASLVHPSTFTSSPAPLPTAPLIPPSHSNNSMTSPSPSSASAPSSSSSSSSSLSAPATITSRLQSLTHRQFIDFLSPLFSALMDPLYRAAAIRTVMTNTLDAIERELDVTASLPPTHHTVDAAHAHLPTSSRLLASLAGKKAEYQSNLSMFNDVLVSASEFLHLRVSKLLHTRSALHSHLTLTEFRELLDVVLAFLQQSEGMCHKPFYGMRGALLTQAKGFVSNFHAHSMKEMAEGLEKEKWQRVDVEIEYQQLLDAGFIIKTTDKGKEGGGGAGMMTRRKEEKENSEAGGRGLDVRADAINGTRGGEEEKKEGERVMASSTFTFKSMGRADRKVLFVPIPKGSAASPTSSSASSPSSSSSNFLKFPVVRSLLLLLTLISHYVDLSSHLPALTLDTLHRLLELLTLFNSRTCQLVLGAGAMHLAGLKSITATHLALSSQSIALLASQIPRLRSLFESRLAVKHRLFLQGFDRVQTDCEQHCEQIREKLINIMRELIDTSIKKMTQHIHTQWKAGGAGKGDKEGEAGGDGGAGEADEDEDDDVVSPAVRTLMKQTCSLHRALTDLLSGRERSLIFREIGGSLVGGFMIATRRMEGEGGTAMGTGKSAERLRMLLQANGLHVLMRMRTLTGVDEEVIIQLKEFVEQLKGGGG